MTALLEKAFDKASRLPAAVQEQLAEQLLEDIAGEPKWDKTLENSQTLLEKLGRRALRAKRQGKVVRKGFDEL